MIILKVLFVVAVFALAVSASVYWTQKIQNHIRNRRAIRAGAREARKAERERIAKMQKMQEIYCKLNAQVFPARPRMKPEKKTLYSNKETGTVVFQIFTSNSTLPGGCVSECFVWAYFLIGNADGFIATDEWLDSEAEIDNHGVSEDSEAVKIHQSGFKVTNFGIRVPVGNLIFKKVDFKPYPPKA